MSVLSYTQSFQKRTHKVYDVVVDYARKLATYELPVEYGSNGHDFLIEVFDLESRGLRNVFRTLFNRVKRSQVLPLPSKNGKNRISRMVVEECADAQGPPPVSDQLVALFKDAFEKARSMTLGYLECLELLGCPDSEWLEAKRTLGFYFALALSNELEDFLKYQTASLMALALSNNVDSAPDCVKAGRWRVGDFIPYCKRATYWVRLNCIQRRGLKGSQAAFSIYHTKHIAPAMSEESVKKSLDKNMVALTTDKDIPDVIELREECVRTVRELYYYATHPTTDFNTAPSAADQRNKEIRSKVLRANEKHLKIPSLSACYENTRSRGGALCHLLKESNTDILIRGRILLGYADRHDKHVEPVEVRGILDDDELVELMRPSLDGFGSHVFVRREPILEPFKVRVISKGEAKPYQRAQNYQPFLWSLLQLSNVFSLTGRPMCNEDLNKVLRFGKQSRQHCQIVSGDYTAATDNLHPWLCESTLSEICNLWKIPFEDALNLKSCLTGHLIDDRTATEFKMNKLTGHIDDSDLELPINKHCDRKQIWGQLMGSPVSFPLLCIINAAVTRFAMERSFEREISLRDDAFLVNGDDVIFTIPSAGYQFWVSKVTQAGLTPSLGKNYVSRRYGVINSQLYDCGVDWDWMENNNISVTHVPLVKMNLVMITQHETTERRKGPGLFVGEALRHGKTLEGRMKELIKGWSGEMRERLLQRAYFYAKPYLNILPKVSWTLPKSLGGLGLPALKDHVVMDHHLKLASLVVCSDSETRRDLMRLAWLREPGTAFCEYANDHLNEVYDKLKIPTVNSVSKTDDPLYSRVIKSALGHGIDTSILNPERVLWEWSNMYRKWLRLLKKVNWITEEIVPICQTTVEDCIVKPIIETIDDYLFKVTGCVLGTPSSQETPAVKRVIPGMKRRGGLHQMSQTRAQEFYDGSWTRSVPAYFK